MDRLSLLLILLFLILGAVPKPAKSTCGYESCNKEKPGMINVHLVPHTHDDVGWIVTVDQYYYKEVQFILDSVIPELAADPNKRFIYVEMAFLARWLKEQEYSTITLVQQLVNEGRLEFIIGGWCMNDEATTHYTAIIDQHTTGFEFLRNNFGECARTKIAWQIDPFGHSREQASLFAQFGFDGLFFGRLDDQDKAFRQKEKRMEFVWRGSPHNLGAYGDLFTGVLPNQYNPPDGFCFDIKCVDINNGQGVFNDDFRLHDFNIEQMVDKFIQEVNDQAKSFATNHLIMTMGSDFQYMQAKMNFKEYDKLIFYVNARQVSGSNVNLLYSTPSCYLKQLNNDNRTWTTKEDDFLPLGTGPHAFWTGFFTSRPTLKGYSRVVNRFFQAVKRIEVLSMLPLSETRSPFVQYLAEVLAVAQHHDAITGTERQVVAYDYAQRMADGVNGALKVMRDAFIVLMQQNRYAVPPYQQFCLYLNISICNVTETPKQFQVTIYNPLARPVDYVARLPVNGDAYTVLAPDGVTHVQTDLMPVSIGTSRIPTPGGEPAPASKELVFAASLPALGFMTYFGQETSQDEPRSPKEEEAKPLNQSPSDSNIIQGKIYSLYFDLNGYLQTMTNKMTGASVVLNQTFSYYKAFNGGDSSPDGTSSSAYFFRPMNETPIQIPLKIWGGVRQGYVVQEAHQQFSDWVTQVYRVYEDKPYVEVEWTVGPIPIDDKIGKEVITRYNIPKFGNNGTFYTDSNGREILERKLNYRPTWNLNQTEPVAGNYYPVNTFIGIRSGTAGLQFTVLTDRAQGASSINDGDVEIMLHRRLLHKDTGSLQEALNETGSDGKGLIVRGKHYLMLDTVEKSARGYRTIAQEVFLAPQLSFTVSADDPKNYAEAFRTNWTGLRTALPANVHLLSLELFNQTSPTPPPDGTMPVLIRFEHFYEVNEDPELSKPVTFDIKNLFWLFNITDARELSLGANIPIEEVHRLQWNTEGQGTGSPSKLSRGLIEGTTMVSLKPMQIVTLQANVKVPDFRLHETF